MRRGALGQVLRITVHENNQSFKQIIALLQEQQLGEYQIVKHVRVLKSAMALHHSKNKIKLK